MRLILHIGTPKTGTTAVQRFLCANRQRLAESDVHYATPHGSGQANDVANALGTGDSRAVNGFLVKQVKAARQCGADTLLISAENFYARNIHAAMQRQQIVPNAPERDQMFVEALRELIPDEIATCQIACYLRRPDQYAESLYNQHVKRGIIDSTFDEFLSLIEPALSYDRCLYPWADYFGQRNCVLRVYDSAKRDVVGDFVMNVLNIQDVSQFSHVHNQANERLARDLLEFKRLKNRTARFGERHVEDAIFSLVNEEIGLRREEPTSYQDFLSPDERVGLLRRLQPEMDALQASYDLPAFPTFDREAVKANWSPYPGLTRERREAIEMHYDRVNRRVAFRLERMTLRSAGLLRKNVPGSGALIDALKRVGVKRALHGFLGGMRGGAFDVR
jgi:hypothetical protein